MNQREWSVSSCIDLADHSLEPLIDCAKELDISIEPVVVLGGIRHISRGNIKIRRELRNGVERVLRMTQMERWRVRKVVSVASEYRDYGRRWWWVEASPFRRLDAADFLAHLAHRRCLEVHSRRDLALLLRWERRELNRLRHRDRRLSNRLDIGGDGGSSNVVVALRSPPAPPLLAVAVKRRMPSESVAVAITNSHERLADFNERLAPAVDNRLGFFELGLRHADALDLGHAEAIPPSRDVLVMYFANR